MACKREKKMLSLETVKQRNWTAVSQLILGLFWYTFVKKILLYENFMGPSGI